MASLFSYHSLADLITLSVLEIVLGIDNLVILAIMVARLDPEEQPRARKVGLLLAMVSRICLLSTMAWLTKLTQPFWIIPTIEFALSGRDLVLLAGGLFLVAKATKEIHDRLETGDDDDYRAPEAASFWPTVMWVAVIDIVFSLDSVVTAVGIADHLIVMILAVIVAVMIMLWFSGPISDFINDHPAIKMLALTFLVLIGVMLIAEATHHHINKAYIYFAMAYSLGVEMLIMKSSSKKKARSAL